MVVVYLAVQCTRLANPLNGLVNLEGVTLSSAATYSCEEGFQLNGQTVRICESIGDWSGTAPTCTSKQLKLPAISFSWFIRKLIIIIITYGS